MTSQPARLRVAVVGAGIGAAHVKGYLAVPDRFEVVAVCDIDADRARKVADEHHVPRVVTSLTTLCSMEELDIIDVCTPPHLHFEQVQQVLEASKHAICEKPLVGSLREVDELVRIERASGRRIMPIFQYRFGHGLQKLKLLIASGVAGPAYLATVETAWRRRAAYYEMPWRGKWATELGGALLGHAIHAHDMLNYVLGPARRVTAYVATRVNTIEVEDCAAIALEMSDGSVASLGGLVAESNTRPYTNSGDPWTFVGDSPELDDRIAATLAKFEPLPEHYAGQFYRFYDALRDGHDPPVTLADARVALELITAMYYSAETGQGMSLPIGTDHGRYASWLPRA
jgi:predicted dehydrogenase